MKKLQVLALAALVAFGFASCAKDNAGNGNNVVGNGETAQMGLSFSVTTNETRADADQTATALESKINTVTVFIFDANGDRVKTGSWNPFTLTDFTPDDVDNPTTWTLKNSITTEYGNGTIKVYVATNLPAAYDKEYASVNDLLEQTADVVNIIDASTTQATTATATNAGFVMFTEEKVHTLNAESVTTLEASLGRVVSKVVTTWPGAGVNFQNQWNNGPLLTYKVEKFNVYNDAYATYLPENTNTLSTLFDFDESYAAHKNVTATVYTGAGAEDPNLTDLLGIYVGENDSVLADPQGDKTSRVGFTTYAMVQTSVKLDRVAKWVTEKTENSVTVPAHVEWTTNGTPGFVTDDDDDLYLVAFEGMNYITNVEDDAREIATYLGADGIVTYPKSKVHFRVFLNRGGDNVYVVGRNEYIHVNVEGIKPVNGSFPGWPGTPDDEEKPTPPEEDPFTPIDPEKAELLVKIDVLKWNYKPNNVTLE